LTVKTERATISFGHSFSLKELDYAAGRRLCRRLIEGMSWLAYRRVATFLHIPHVSASQDFRQRVPVDHANLEAALVKDRHR
jgi:hypothetical protein